jgi:outer membrane lipoprotein SlyB
LAEAINPAPPACVRVVQGPAVEMGRRRRIVMNRWMKIVTVAAVAVLAAGCAHQPQGLGGHEQEPVYAPSHGGQVDYTTQYGVVSAIRLVDSRGSNASGAGAAIGAIAGALIGREFGFSSDGRATGVVLGTMGGAILGNEIEKDHNGRRSVVRVSVQLDGGGTRSFDFGSAGDLRIGDRVRIQGRQLYRM